MKPRTTAREPIDWAGLETLMLKAFCGTTLTDREQQQINTAFKRDAKKYSALHQRVVRAEIAERQKRGF